MGGNERAGTSGSELVGGCGGTAVARGGTDASGGANGAGEDASVGGDTDVSQHSGGSGTSDAGIGGAEACVQVPFSADTPEAQAWQDRMTEAIVAGPDCRSSSEGLCAAVTSVLDRGSPWCASVGQRVLHLDEFGYGDFERIHGRILSYLTIDMTGSYVERSPTVTMQQGRFSIERELGEAAFSLDGLKTALATLAEKNPYSPPRGHGDSFVQLTQRRAPHAQSLVADLPSLSCDSEQSRATLRRQVQSLREFIDHYGVRYIVMSGGVTRQHFSHCGQDADLLLRIQLDEFYAPLAAIPGTVFIQSAPNPSETDRELVVDDPEFLVDCTPLPGRIRVSFAGVAHREVPPEGIGYGQFRDALSVPMRNTAACVDAFVAFFDQSEDFLATSAVPPIVVAMAIAAENSEPLLRDATGEQRARIIIGEDAPRLFDPLGNMQFESF